MNSNNIDNELSNILNGNYDERERQEYERRRREEIFNYNYEMAQRAMNTSLRREEIARDASKRAREIAQETRKKIALILAGITLVTALTIPAAKEMHDDIKEHKAKISAINEGTGEIFELFAKYEEAKLSIKNENFTFANYINSTNPFSPEEVTPETVHKYYLVLKTLTSESELNAFFGILPYYNETGDIAYYRNFQDYLHKNGYSSEVEFKEEIEGTIGKGGKGGK